MRDRARELFDEYQYAKAVEIYEKLVDGKRPRLEDLEHLAECYRLMNDYLLAENWYARVVQDRFSHPENLLRYADVLKGNGKYREAKQTFQHYAEMVGNSQFVQRELAGCDSAMVWMSRPTGHSVQNEAAINTFFSEFGIYGVRHQLYYVGEPVGTSHGRNSTYGWTGNPFLALHAARTGADGRLEALGRLDSTFAKGPYHVGPITSDAMGKVLYVTRTYEGREVQREREGKKRYRTRKLELYSYIQGGDGEWQETPFAYNNAKAYSVGHASESPDGRILYFVSDMPGGQGGTDIWYCERQSDCSWGNPKNAGLVVNSVGDELFPYLGRDGTLYFSSNGWIGMGNLDIFRAVGECSNWAKPVNMGFPLNSAADDFAYMHHCSEGLTDMGYMASNRKDGLGGDDIYSYSYTHVPLQWMLRGVAYDRESGQVIPDVQVSLQRQGGKLFARTTSGDRGMFLFEIEPEQGYELIGEKIGYLPGKAKASTAGLKGGDTLDVTIYLDRLSVGKTFRLENIYYDLDRHDIRSDAALVLDTLVATLRDNPELTIELSSHTDSRASHAYNMKLSQRRAQAAIDYMVGRGIERRRLVAKGYGETRLLNGCADGVTCSEEEHQLNRRTEFTVLSDSSEATR